MNEDVEKISQIAFDDAMRSLRKAMSEVAVEKRKVISEGEAIDPVAAAFEMHEYDQDFEAWKEDSELPRRWQKSLTTHLGRLHQDLLGALEGWESFHPDPKKEEKRPSEPDLVGRIGTQKVIVELKSSQNTFNGSSKSNAYDGLCARLDGTENDGKYGEGYIGIVVLLRTNTGKKGLWAPFTAGKDRPERRDLWRMGGRTFYALATDVERRPFLANGKNNKPADLEGWASWKSIDDVFTRIFSTLEAQGGKPVPSEIKDLVKNVYEY